MALFRWQGNGGGVKSDWNDGRNWLDGTGTPYAQARYPGSLAVTYDDVLFDDALVTGALSPAAYDAVAAVDTELLTFKIGPDFNGTIASAGVLKIQVNRATSEIIIEGKATGVINLNINTTPIFTLLNSAGILTLDGTITELSAFQGTLVLAATLTVNTTFRTSFLESKTRDLTLTIPTGTTLPATVTVDGGTVTSNLAITTINMSGGKWTQQTGAITNLTITGGTFQWDGGTITALKVSGTGVFDGSVGTLPRTLTGAELYATGSIKLNNNVNTITLTNNIDVKSDKVNLSFSTGTSLTF